MVRRAVQLLYKEIKGLHQAAYVLGVFAFGSQLLAIARDRLLAHTFGAGVELDIYYTAFRVPDLLFVLFASIFSVYVLLPFVERSVDDAARRELLSQAFTLFLVGFSVLAGLLALLAPLYVPVLFPGLDAHADQLVPLLQILLIQPLLLGISNICGVVTQVQQRFVLYALSPLLYNMGIIFGILALYPYLGMVGLVWGVVLGALGHLLIQVPYVWGSSLTFTFTNTWNWKLLWNLFQTAFPRSVTMSLNQLVLLLFVSIATTFTVGSVAVFQLAYNIQSVPLAIIGMSYSVAAFPTLSALFARQERDLFNAQILIALRHIIFWSVPIIGLAVVLRAHIVRILLGSGAFDWADTRLTAAVLAVFVVSLAAQALLLLLVRALYAGGRTTVPLVLTLISSGVAVVTALVGLWVWGQFPWLQSWVQQVLRLETLSGAEIAILAAAYSVGQVTQVVLLLNAARRLFDTPLVLLRALLFRAVAATVVGVATTYATLQFVLQGVNQDTLVGLTLQGGTAAVFGVVAVFLIYRILRTPELSEITTSFRRRMKSE